MKRTDTRLADGRELIYYDIDERADRSHPDTRDLAAVPTSSEVRYDPLLAEWVAIAAHRQNRTHLPADDQCPLCPSRHRRATEIPAPDYEVAVFENRFPTFGRQVDEIPTEVEQGSRLFAREVGRGRCEVVCFTSDHHASCATLTVAQSRLLIDAWADRTADLSTVAGVEQVFCFENRGREIGVTMAHPHGQIYAYPFVTPRTQTMLTSARRHMQRTGRNIFVDLLEAERDAGVRRVTGNDHWTAFVPAAARWPVEVHLYPHRRVPDLPALEDAERDALAEIQLDVLRRLDLLYDDPLPYVAAWHQAPVRIGRDVFCLHLQVFSTRRSPDKLKYLAGSESAMGVFANDVPPEHAAARLRAVG